LTRSSPGRLIVELDRDVLGRELVPDLAVARELVCVSETSEKNLHAFLRLSSIASSRLGEPPSSSVVGGPSSRARALLVLGNEDSPSIVDQCRQ
jgi:hypothetical protein